jgi:hypothetical protein
MRVSVATRSSRASRRARATSSTLALACASIASVARAAPEPIALHYQAVAGCPNPEFFASQVTARTAQVRFDEAGALGSFRVVLERTASGYAGVLSITDRNGKESVRRFEAESCDNVVVALALVAALAIDPNAVATPEAPFVAPTGASPERAPASAPVPDARETEPTRVSRAPSEPALVFDRQFAPGPGAYRAWSWSVGATAQGLGGVTPSLLEAFGGFFGVEKKGVGWSPGFRLSSYYGATGQTAPAVDRAEFVLLVARVAGCPYRAPLTKGSRVSPCAGLDVGWIRARGNDGDIDRPLKKDGLWLSLSLDAQLELAVTDAIFMEVNGGLGVPLIRHWFQFETPGEPADVVYQVPQVSGHGGFSVGARFP